MIVDVVDLNLEKINFKRNFDSVRYSKAIRIYSSKGVEVNEVDLKEYGQDKIYNVTANVRGSYSYYAVNLKIKNQDLVEYNCTCPDASDGKICKHILAACKEVVDPHYPSTKEGIEKLLEMKRQEEEKRIAEYRRRQEEEEKRYEYQRKYYNALKVLNQCKGESAPILGAESSNIDENDINVEDIYNNVKLEMIISKPSNIEYATKIKIEPKIEFSFGSSLNVTFKIGQTTMYSLKDIESFCNAFQTGEVLDFGKKLKFFAKRENFRDEDKELLEYIINYGTMLKYQKEILIESSKYYNPADISTKMLLVFEDKIDDFFEIIKNREIHFFSWRMQDVFVEFSKKKYMPSVNMEKNENGDLNLKLNLKKYEYIVSNKKIYLISTNKIYELDKTKDLLELYNIFDGNSEILIPADKLDEFNTYVLPKIDKYIVNDKLESSDGKNSGEKDNIKDRIAINKLASKVYLDLDEKENISLRLNFCYFDYEFNILDKDYKQYVKENNITRNIIEEKNVLTRLFIDGFETEKDKNYFVLKDLDHVYDFLSEKIEGYMNDFEVLVTDRFKNKKVKKAKISNIGVRVDNGLLNIDMSKIDVDIDEIKKVLQSYNLKKKYYKLNNGDFLDLQKSEELDFLNDISNNLDVDFNKIDKGIIKLPVNRSLYLEKLLVKNKNINAERNGEYNRLVNNIGNKNFTDEINIDKKFENILRSYQKTGYKWLKVLEQYGFGGILADDMGLGKTLQIIALLASSINKKNKVTSIVVCPSSLVLNWKSEVEKWCPKIKVMTISGDASIRKELINDYKNYDLIVTSYDLLKRDVLEYENKKFKYIIADEAQYIKNSSTQNATALKSLAGEVKYALTGTPIENSVAELWSIFDFIMPGYLYNYNKFKKKFEQPIIKSEDKEALKKLKALIEPFVLRRVKSDVLTELPDKNITVMKSEMTKEQQKLYIAYLSQIKKEVNVEVNKNGFEKSKMKILMLLTRLRQICCHPSLFIENYKGESGKLEQCMDVLNEAVESGHKILLFSQYTSMFEIIEEKLNKLNINYYKLTGSTPVSKRIDMVDEFNKNDDIKVFLISLKAGGTGLNLTGADVVIHYDPWWNLSSENQATDRAYRIGQKNSVQVYKFITTNSIEEKINKLQEKKAKLSEELLSTEETFINTLSKDEIMALFD